MGCGAGRPITYQMITLIAGVNVLADAGDVSYQAFNGAEIVRAARWMPQVAEAIRSGGAPPALSWAPEDRPEFNRAVFLNLLGKQMAAGYRRRGPAAAQRAARTGGGPGLRNGLS